MGKINEFSIHLDSQQRVYYPRQTISGNVTVDLNKPMSMRGIRIKLTGKAACHWTERETRGTGDNRRTETVHYRGSETLINQKFVLWGHDSSSSEKFEHPEGRAYYPFKFILPEDKPSSFEGRIGHIRYVLKANIDKPWKFDPVVKRPIIINDIIDTNNPVYAEPIGGDKHKDVGCLCCKAGPLELSASIDRSCYCPGEAIFINALVQNQTTRDMQDLHAKITKRVIYHARSPKSKTKVDSVQCARLVGPVIPKLTDYSWKDQPLGIPAIPPTITNCSVVKVMYNLEIVVAIPWGMDPSIDMSITVGTVPYLKMYGQQVQYGAPDQAPAANFVGDLAYPPPQPSAFGYPDMPPPSYSAAVGQTPVHIGKEDKDTHTYGELSYTPVYTYAQPYHATDAPPMNPPHTA